MIPNIPRILTVKNNTKVLVEFLQEKDISKFFRIAHKNSSNPATGVAPSDFPSEEHLLQSVRASIASLQYSIEGSDTYVGFSVMFPNDMCRSCRPVSFRGFTILDPDIHNIGLGHHGLRIVRPYARDVGYPGFIGRSVSTNVLGLLHARKLDLNFQAWVPDSYKDAEGRWHDDLICVSQFYSTPEIDQATNTDILEKCRQKSAHFVYGKEPFKGQPVWKKVSLSVESTCIFRTATYEDLQELYPILVRAAWNGEGFGLDEYPSENIFREHFLNSRTALVFHREKGDMKSSLLAIGIVGPSRICRSPDPPNCSMYLWVSPNNRRLGIGVTFANYVMEYLKESGYKGVLTDVLMSKSMPYTILSDLGFSNVGCIPKSAYIANEGYSDAILFYKRFNNDSKI